MNNRKNNRKNNRNEPQKNHGYLQGAPGARVRPAREGLDDGTDCQKGKGVDPARQSDGADGQEGSRTREVSRVRPAIDPLYTHPDLNDLAEILSALNTGHKLAERHDKLRKAAEGVVNQFYNTVVDGALEQTIVNLRAALEGK